MKKLLANFSEITIAESIHSNLADFWSSYGRCPNGMLIESRELTCFITGIPSPLFNGVLRSRLPVNNIEKQIDETLSHFTAKNSPMYWWIGPHTQPGGLGIILESRGLTKVAAPKGMAIDLENLTYNTPINTSLRIEKVKNLKMLQKWTHTALTGFGIPDPIEEVFFPIEAFSPPKHYYIGFIGNEPVGTSLLFTGSDTAGLYWIATTPEARGNGIGYAMTLAPLCEAKKMGYKIGVLQASPMGYKLYKKIGFREYCAFERYLWRGNKI